ncbi:MAG: DUF1778 domain-containing protein [Verrucomicrobia bacterium]|nr:DUF1778 domain-containing protein [Verrucomicrobiota bacterium]
MPTLVKTPKVAKGGRLVARVSSADKAVITRAASLAGQSVGSFVVAQARKAALETLETHDRIVLSTEQSRRFVEALLAQPTAPTQRMREAIKLSRVKVTSDLD